MTMMLLRPARYDRSRETRAFGAHPRFGQRAPIQIQTKTSGEVLR